MKGTAQVERNVALIYVRVSRLDDDERARKVSPATQLEKARALRELDGLDVQIFEDLDISGKATMNRPGYLAMIERLERGGVKYVVAYDQSRITRNVGDLQRFREAIARAGALFIEASTGRMLDPDDEDQELGSNVIGSVDQHYRRKLARRVRDALATKVAHGDLVGPVPAGYVRRREILENGKVARLWVEPDPERAPIVQTIFREYATGAFSLKSLARELNARGLRPPRPPHFHNGQAPAEIFTADTLKDILSNPRYVGRIPRRDGTSFVGNYAALVDEETWTACERVRKSGRRVRLSSAERRPSRYSLSGLLRCGACGSTMSGWTRGRDRSHPRERAYYLCYDRRVAGSCHAPSVEQDRLEGDVEEILAAVALPAGFAETVDAALAAYEGARGQTERSASIGSVEARSGRLRDLYELGDITRDDYIRRRDQFVREASAIRAAGEPTFVRQRTSMRSLVDDWDEMSADQRKRVLGTMFEEVIVDGDGISELVPREGWRPYLKAALGEPRVLSERKTGLEPAVRSRRSSASAMVGSTCCAAPHERVGARTIRELRRPARQRLRANGLR